MYLAAMPYAQMGRARIFGRIGASHWGTKAKAQSGGASASDKETGWSPVVGAGLEYRLGRSLFDWTVRLDWARHFQVGDDNATGESDVDTVMASIVLRN